MTGHQAKFCAKFYSMLDAEASTEIITKILYNQDNEGDFSIWCKPWLACHLKSDHLLTLWWHFEKSLFKRFTFLKLKSKSVNINKLVKFNNTPLIYQKDTISFSKLGGQVIWDTLDIIYYNNEGVILTQLWKEYTKSKFFESAAKYWINFVYFLIVVGHI